MQSTTETELVFDIRGTVAEVLKTIEKEREREIITRRFGLDDSKQTLEEIGSLLGITRERVRQIEKQVITRLTSLKHPTLEQTNEIFVSAVRQLGNIAPLAEVAERVGARQDQEHAHVNFLATLSTDVDVIAENDNFHHSVILREQHDPKTVHALLEELTAILQEIGKPVTAATVHQRFDKVQDLPHLEGLMRAAKHITNLEDSWGLSSWPLVNPKSIRDKIYVILQRHGKSMHFEDIANTIKTSRFKRRDVTTQAIHNELIKDKRFVLVGRGIYGLEEWGYKQGTVADIIEDVLRKESPLHRDEIVKRVLQQRHVKPTTIIINLQGKQQFKRVAKATYALAN